MGTIGSFPEVTANELATTNLAGEIGGNRNVKVPIATLLANLPNIPTKFKGVIGLFSSAHIQTLVGTGVILAATTVTYLEST